jgi:hypothetical protein
VASVLLAANTANAAVAAFASRNAFDTAFAGASRENWDSYAAGTTIANGGTLNGITYNSSAGIAIVTSAFLPSTPPNSLGRTPTEFFAAIDTITFSFATPLLAFGIDINTNDFFSGSYQLTTNLGDVVNSVFDPFPGFTTGQFAGFSSNVGFTSVTISSSSMPYTLDSLRYVPMAVQSAPDGGVTLLLLGSAVGVLLSAYRKHASVV